MYILGFILIFTGLGLMLYYFVLRFAGSRPDPIRLHSVQSGSGSFSGSDMDVTVAATPINYGREIRTKENSESVRDAAPPSRTFDSTDDRSYRIPASRGTGDLYATGYLYTDSSGKSALLEHPERAEGELTAGMKRLGPATLRFRRDSFYFDHGDGLLVITEKQMREVRFTDGGTVFVPGGSELPVVYFFTVETQSIRDFLSQRS